MKEGVILSSEIIDNVGKWCKVFRTMVLHVSLTDFCNQNNVNIKNVSAFENGRANNIKYVFLYYNSCTSDEMRIRFMTGFFALGEVVE